MIKSSFGLTKEPFYRSEVALLPQQSEAIDMIKIHAQHGGFSVIVGAWFKNPCFRVTPTYKCLPPKVRDFSINPGLSGPI